MGFIFLSKSDFRRFLIDFRFYDPVNPLMLLSHLGENVANGLTNAINCQLAMIARCSPDIRMCS